MAGWHLPQTVPLDDYDDEYKPGGMTKTAEEVIALIALVVTKMMKKLCGLCDHSTTPLAPLARIRVRICTLG